MRMPALLERPVNGSLTQNNKGDTPMLKQPQTGNAVRTEHTERAHLQRLRERTRASLRRQHWFGRNSC